MSSLDILLAIAGFGATALVVAGMILLTPRGEVDVHDDATNSQGAQLSRADAPAKAAGALSAPPRV
jgi:hypothetical protein